MWSDANAIWFVRRNLKVTLARDQISISLTYLSMTTGSEGVSFRLPHDFFSQHRLKGGKNEKYLARKNVRYYNYDMACAQRLPDHIVDKCIIWEHVIPSRLMPTGTENMDIFQHAHFGGKITKIVQLILIYLLLSTTSFWVELSLIKVRYVSTSFDVCSTIDLKIHFC